MKLPFVESSGGNDAHLFLIPMSLLAAALGLCALMLVLQWMPTSSAAGLVVDEAQGANSLPPSA